MNQLVRSIDDHAPLVIVLDGVEDPQNFGTLLRVADAAGVDGVIVSKRRSSPVTAAVAKASVGAVEHVKIVEVANIASTLTRLNQEALWIVGADLESDLMYYELDLAVPLAIVLGGEGKGLSRLVKERCDYLARLPMLGNVSSLNVATTGAALLYEVVRQRQIAAGP
jgi:23S rRNA (guanosine2251-2'-O)-methyltransferase